MSADQVAAAELHEAIQEYQQQLAAVAEIIAEHPGNVEAQEILAELQEGLTTTQAAYAERFPTSRSSCPANDLKEKAAPEAVPTATAPKAAAVQQPQTARPPSSRTMHPDNLYCSKEPDFAALALQHPPLAAYLTTTKAGRPALDFTNWHATKELTAALLKVDFGVIWDLPEGQLVPPVPNRANYIHWINDLLQLSSPSGGGTVRGLDIGCGANLIYCLLGAAVYGWHMTGVDVTPVALQGAAALREANPQLANLLEVRQSQCLVGQLPQQRQQQVQQYLHSAEQLHQQQAAVEADSDNKLQLQQQMQHATNSPPQQQEQQQQQQQQQQHALGPLLGAMANSTEQFHFCMCNPPFFETLQEANQNPNTACGGTAEEMVCAGGELAFIRAMIDDSRRLKGRVHWYSSMCGKKASLKVLRQQLHTSGVTAVRTTELVQGKTSRWAIAWSFAANPNTANMPLPRRKQQQQQQQQQQSIDRKLSSTAAAASAGSRAVRSAQRVSFSVTAAVADGTKLLQSIAALLTAVARATEVQTDSNNWKVRCKLPAADAAGLAQQQQQQQAGSTSEPAAKRAKAAAGIYSSSSSSPMTDQVAAEVCVFQQRRGTYDVVASVPPGSSKSDVLITAISAVREDLALMWQVGELLCS